MSEDIGTLDYDTCVIPHHYDPNIPKHKVRHKGHIVAYWGREVYLGRYRKKIQMQCEELGWEFWVNPPIDKLSVVDRMVGFRDTPYDDYYSVAYKSNVKQATAQALRVPFHCFWERSYIECASDETEFLEPGQRMSVHHPIDRVNDFSIDYCVAQYNRTIASWLNLKHT